jgi:hypothetical protein
VGNTSGTPIELPPTTLHDGALLPTMFGMFQQLMASQMQMFQQLVMTSRTVSLTAAPNQGSDTGTSITATTTAAAPSNGNAVTDGTELTSRAEIPSATNNTLVAPNTQLNPDLAVGFHHTNVGMPVAAFNQ